MAKSAMKKAPVKKAASKSARKVAPSARPAGATKKAEAARQEAAKQEAARSKLERVKVPPPKREDGTEGKYVYCVIRSDQPLSFGPLGLGPEPAEVHTIHFRDIAAVVSNTPIVVQDP